jgi:uncharacterized membrane protein YfcA
VALGVSALTLFSGFGLGALLMPAFALFFPVEFAIAATAVVHLANNIFKFALLGKKANPGVVLAFGLPAVLLAFVGAFLLNYFAALPPLVEYSIGNRSCELTMVKLVISVLIMIFAILELSPRFQNLAIDTKYVPLGGVLSGFFGGLSGNQGALRAAFLIRLGLEKEVFIGTSIVCAVLVDIARLTVYGITFFTKNFALLQNQGGVGLIIAGSLAAFIGAFWGSRLLKKITMRTVKNIVGAMLLMLALALGTGLV